ncbi:hypothetical protein J5O04_00750 [Corynebacterium hindlerae]|uniref:CG0192 family protein n=1 Tax=Corynebacterium hindlerae TaxID=699041 RepID=UPI001AD7246C|nr:hypothetical protein [Corynebacterium hindlerae]QTH59712.1 hypothetical protein J5O04_00750 [Corynebacterium hindlerae]
MSGVAEILAAELTPSKEEVLRAWWPNFQEKGAFRLVDPAGEVGIDFVIGTDEADRYLQLPVTYRSAELDGGSVGQLEHSVLGTRYLTKATYDHVAVGEIVRVILAGDNEAQRSDAKPQILKIKGSGQTPSTEVTEVVIEDASEERVFANAKINGVGRSFELRLPRRLLPVKYLRASRVPSPRNITGVFSDSEEPLVIAELIWRDL